MGWLKGPCFFFSFCGMSFLAPAPCVAHHAGKRRGAGLISLSQSKMFQHLIDDTQHIPIIYLRYSSYSLIHYHPHTSKEIVLSLTPLTTTIGVRGQTKKHTSPHLSTLFFPSLLQREISTSYTPSPPSPPPLPQSNQSPAQSTVSNENESRVCKSYFLAIFGG